MFQETTACHLTVMVMVTNDQDEVLSLERIKSWPGITFPGGHLEADESVLDCARREVLEETGIRIHQLRLTGLIHWLNRENGERYLVHCVRSKALGGSLHDSAEGPVAWLPLAELPTVRLCPGFLQQLPLFFEGGVQEAFGTYGSTGDSPLTFDEGA